MMQAWNLNLHYYSFQNFQFNTISISYLSSVLVLSERLHNTEVPKVLSIHIPTPINGH
jgi:hypothetical protein